jgi:ubinuclein
VLKKAKVCFRSHFRIEKDSRQLTCSQRSGIYNHLAAFLPCSKDTLLKRAKKLRLNEQDNKVRDPINKLKEGE